MGTLTYDRNSLTWDRDTLDELVEAGRAKLHVTRTGPVYVVKNSDGASYAVRSHQIVASAPKVSATPDLASLRAAINDHDSDVDYRRELLRSATEQGVSVEEFTDGEYVLQDGIPVSLHDIHRREEELLDKFLR